MPEWTGTRPKRSLMQRNAEKNLAKREHGGQLSKKSMLKMKNAVGWLTQGAKEKRVYSKKDGRSFTFKVNFITLTIPPQSGEVVSEKIFKQVLHRWLVYAQKYLYLNQYVWKIEAHEDKRLHVHICSDTFLHHRRVRDSWNKALDTSGLLDAHFEKFGNKNPNSTDIHAVWKVRNIAAYMCEYMAKKPNLPDGYKGRIWSCSYNLSSNSKCTLQVSPDEMSDVMRSLTKKQMRYSHIESAPDAMGQRKKIGELFFIRPEHWKSLITGPVQKAFQDHLYKIRQRASEPPIEWLYVDEFKSREKLSSSNFINQVKNKGPCETRKGTQRSGMTQSVLQF